MVLRMHLSPPDLLLLFLLAHLSHTSGGSGMGDLQWLDFTAVNQSCPGDQGQGRGGPYKGVHSSGVCDPYMTGKWCADGVNLLGLIKCTSTKKDRRKCQRISEGCMYPFKVLATKSDSRVLPLLHAARPGEIDGCLRRRAEDRPVHFLFVGDSQTRMLEFEFRRWASRGEDFPRYEEIMGLGGDRTSWSSSGVLVTQLVRRCGADAFSEKANVAQRLRAAMAEVPARSRLVVVVGSGIWDVVSSNCSSQETVSLLQGEYNDMLNTVVSETTLFAREQGASVDYYLRNMFFSYDIKGKPFLEYLPLVNNVISQSYYTLMRWYKENTAVRFHLLDVYGLSSLRKSEMPYFGDGLHWACQSKSPYQQCHHAFAGSGRPDEVAWATMQLVLLDYCGLYSL